MYIGSADLMPRNLYNRVELVAPIFDDKVRAELIDVLDRSLADNTNCWELELRRRLDRARKPGDAAAQRPARDDRDPHRALGLRRDGRDPGRLSPGRARGEAHLGDGRAPRRARILARRGRRRARPCPAAARPSAPPTCSSSAAATPGCGPPGSSSGCDPEAEVVVLCEADGCGEGPSGPQRRLRQRALVQPADAARALRRHGRARGRPRRAALGDRDRQLLRRAGRRRLVSPGRLSAGLDRAGLGRRLATRPRRPARTLGEPDACVALDAAEVRRRCASPIFRGGAFYPGAATVQPARLVRGLAAPRARARRRGVTSGRTVGSVRRPWRRGRRRDRSAGGCARGPRCSPPAGRSPGTCRACAIG